MNLNPLRWFQKKASTLTLDQLIERLAMQQNTAAGEHITPGSAMTAPTVFACTRVLAQSVASLPVSVILADGNTRTRLTDHPLRRVLYMQPNRWQTAAQYWMQVMQNLLLHGNHYAAKITVRGEVRQLVPFHPDQVEVEQNVSDGTLLFHVDMMDGQRRTFAQSQMHFISNGISDDGITGVPVINRCREAIALEIAAEKFGAALFSNGAVPHMVVKRPGHFPDKETMDAFVASWNRAFTGNNRHKTVVLEEGWSFDQVQISNEASQFLETRKLQREIICGAFGVPPHKIADMSRSTFSNIEHQSLEYVRDSLTPWLHQIEGAMWRDLLTDQEKVNHRIKFEVDGVLRGDAKSRAEALQILRVNGVLSANEWRALEDMNPRTDEGGDEYLTPLNMEQSGDQDDGQDDQDDGQDDGDQTTIENGITLTFPGGVRTITGAKGGGNA